MKKLCEFRNTSRGLPDELIWNMAPAEGIIKNKDGSLMTSWYFRGEDLDAATHDELGAMSARLNQALCLLGSGWMIHCDAIRRTLVGYPERGAFPDRTTAIIDEERRSHYKCLGKRYETVYAFTITYLPDILIAQKAQDLLYTNREKVEIESREKRLIEYFIKQIEDFEGIISGMFHLKRMKCYTEKDEFGNEYVFDELLEYLESCVSFNRRPVKLSSCPMDVDALIGNYEVYNADNLLIDGKVVKVVAIDGFPQDSYPGILHALSGLPFEYRWSTRFQFLEPYEAIKLIGKERKAWRQKIRGLRDQVFNTSRGAIDIDALHMSQDTEEAMAIASGGNVRFGYYTSVIVLSGENALEVTEAANIVRKTIMNCGYGARVETINTMEAFLGSLPGHGYQNIRKPILHSLNLADMLPTTSVWTGFEEHPSNLYPPHSPPLMVTATSGGAVFRLCLHKEDVGHTFQAGATGSGKTVFINFTIAQHLRYPNARVFGFDRKHGAYVLTMAAGGSYYDLGSSDSELRLRPLGDLETDDDLAWASEYVETLLILQDVIVTSQDRGFILSALKHLKANPKNARDLTTFCSLVQNQKLREGLSFYTLSGASAGIIDGIEDDLGDSHFMMFEMEALAERGEKTSVPVLLYLFRQMEKRLDGKPTLVTLDESWLMLKNPVFADRLQIWLRTWRSKNAHVLLATQELSTIMESPIASTVINNCPTKILMPNREATGTQRIFYEQIGCNEKEIRLIANATQKREYYYKSTVGRRLFALDLSDVALSFVGITSKQDINMVRPIIKEHGERWPAEWLRMRGLGDWADYWLRMQ